MDGLRMMQGYLMAQMRARALVTETSVALGLTPEALGEARERAEELGLGVPGHSNSLYERLLGKPARTSIREDVDSYSRRIDYYVVPPWHRFLLAISHSTDGATSGVAFTKLNPNRRPPRLDDLTPWSMVLDELTVDDCTVVDEWHPMLDYSCSVAGSGHQQAILQFDFGLLQAVVLA